MTHWTSATAALSSVCKAGNATLTTVLSMNAILEPRIVAASTQRCAVFAQGDAPDAIERMDASTHGSWIAMATDRS
jgi:hypothetical protein